MSDIKTLDQALMELEAELSQFKELKPQLDEIASRASSVVEKLKRDISDIKGEAKESIAEVEKAYSTLCDQNENQFQKLHDAWTEKLALAEKAVDAIQSITTPIVEAASRVTEMSAKIAALGKMLSELNMPLKFDKLDSSISSALSATQSLQSRFDRMVKEMDAGFEKTTNEVAQRIEVTQQGVCDSVKGIHKELERTMKDGFAASRRWANLNAIWVYILLLAGLLVNGTMLVLWIMSRS